MKLRNIIILLFFFCIATIVKAQSTKVQTNTIKVFGNCSQCKDRIETALDTKGVKTANWNIETKQLEVIYVPAKISIQQIHWLIAAAGHDTELEKAPDSVYLALPECCLYRTNSNTHQNK